MKKKQTSTPESNDDMLDEYDFTGGVRGKYVGRFADESNSIILSSEVAEALRKAARQKGVAPSHLANELLRQRLVLRL